MTDKLPYDLLMCIVYNRFGIAANSTEEFTLKQIEAYLEDIFKKYSTSQKFCFYRCRPSNRDACQGCEAYNNFHNQMIEHYRERGTRLK